MYNTTFHVKSRHYFYEECFFSSKTISRLNVVYYTYIPQNCFMFGCLDKYTNKRTKLCCYLSTSNHFIFPSSHGQCLVGAHIIYNHRIMETTIENDLRLCTILRNIDVRAGGGGGCSHPNLLRNPLSDKNFSNSFSPWIDNSSVLRVLAMSIKNSVPVLWEDLVCYCFFLFFDLFLLIDLWNFPLIPRDSYRRTRPHYVFSCHYCLNDQNSTFSSYHHPM